MAYVETAVDVKGNLRLNMGVTTSGNVTTKNISIGTLDPNAWDVEKFAAIATALNSFFDHTVYDWRSVKTYNVHE